MNEQLRMVLAVIVATGWLVNLLGPLFVHSYSTSLTANAPLLLILGSLFQSNRSKKKKKHEEEPYKEDYLP